MQPWKSILTILDKPEDPQIAFRRTVDLVGKMNAHAHIVSFRWVPLPDERSTINPLDAEQIEEKIEQEQREWIHRLVGGSPDIDMSTEVVLTPNIAEWARDNVERTHRDLVIKSVNHSEGLFYRPLDWDLLRTCPAPIWFCATPETPTKRILATIDLRHQDDDHRALNIEVLETAQHIAQLLGADLHCVNAIEYSKVLNDLDIINARSIERKAVKKHREFMETLTEPFGASNIHMRAGSVGAVVAEVANEVEADLIVLGTSARSGLMRVLGNSAERILHRAPCDVLAVHRSQHDHGD